MIYKYYSNLSEYAINNYINDKLCFSHVDQFNDINEFQSEMDDKISLPNKEDNLTDDLIELQKLRVRICCFSNNSNLDNMWGYYANNGKGFCLGYDENEIEGLLPQLILKNVSYDDSIPELSEDMAPEDLVMSQITHKKECWHLENEIRACFFLDWEEMTRLSLDFKDSILKDKYEFVFSGMAKVSLPVLPPGFLEEYRKPAIWYAPKNILIPAKPKVLIIGKNCPRYLKEILINIANQKGILIRNQGDINA